MKVIFFPEVMLGVEVNFYVPNIFFFPLIYNNIGKRVCIHVIKLYKSNITLATYI